MFFGSVDSRRSRFVVSCLESTLVGWLVSVAFKWVRASMIWGLAALEDRLVTRKVRPKAAAGKGENDMRTRGPGEEERTWVAPEVEMEMKKPR